MNKKLLIIGFVWPEPKSSATGSRMLQLIEAFQLADYNIIFASSCAKSDNAFDLERIGVSKVSIKINDSNFDDFIEDLQPNVVIFDRFMIEEQFGWRVAEKCPKALRVLDTEDLHCLRKGRHKALKDNAVFSKTYLFNEIAKREIASIYRCDLSLIISEVEMDILINDFKVDKSLLLYLPFMLNTVSLDRTEKLPVFQDRHHFVTIGNFLHEPNYNAVLHLKENIWSLIRKQLPEAQMHVYGAYASLKVNQLHNSKEGFIINGFAESAGAILQQARVCLAPLQFGAGLKGKLFDAMQNGTPSVTTSIGAEGIFSSLLSNGFVEDNPNDFANKAVKLYNDETLWKEKQQNGFKTINERFSKTEHQKKFLNVISETKKQLHAKRLDNFTGQMLMHHTLQSTKFMSKWIEAKNKTH